MAIWQCDFHIRPRTLLEVEGILPITFTDSEETELKTLWGENYSLTDLPAMLSKLLPEARSWSEEIRTWGVEDGDRIDLSGEDGKLEEWFLRIDLRHPSFSFLQAIVGLVQRFDGVFVSSRNYVIPPSYTKLLDHIRRSDSFRFVENPEKFFEELSIEIDDKRDD